MNWSFVAYTFVEALKGMPTTLSITLFTLLFSTPLAFGVAIARSKKIAVLHQVFAVYVSFIRGTPAVLQIYIIYNTLPSALNILFQKWNIEKSIFDVNPAIYAVVVFTLNITATLSEVIRSALLTVKKGQMEAVLSMGMTELQGYIRIVIPQALVSALPNICTLIVQLIKMTSLAFLMTIKDVTAIAKIEAGKGCNYFEAYIAIFIIYLILCIIIEQIFKVLERNLKCYKTAAK